MAQTRVTRSFLAMEALRYLLNAVPAVRGDVEVHLADGPERCSAARANGSTRTRRLEAMALPTWLELTPDDVRAALRPVVARWVRQLRRSQDWPRLARESATEKRAIRDKNAAWKRLINGEALAPPYRNGAGHASQK